MHILKLSCKSPSRLLPKRYIQNIEDLIAKTWYGKKNHLATAELLLACKGARYCYLALVDEQVAGVLLLGGKTSPARADIFSSTCKIMQDKLNNLDLAAKSEVNAWFGYQKDIDAKRLPLADTKAAALGFSLEAPELKLFVVDKNTRDLGLGTALIQAALTDLKSKNIPFVWLKTDSSCSVDYYFKREWFELSCIQKTATGSNSRDSTYYVLAKKL